MSAALPRGCCTLLVLGATLGLKAPALAIDPGHSCITEPVAAAPGGLAALDAWQERLESPDGHFVIHWNSTGDSASTAATAQAVLEGLLAAATVYHDSLGYARPPAAEGTFVPVYLRPQNAMGITVPAENGGNGYTSTLFLDRGFTRWGADSLGIARVTAAHEYFHAVQFGYGFFVGNLAFYEASAVWAEDCVYPEQDDWVTRYGPAFLQDLGLPLDSFSGVRHYGAAMALKVLQAHPDGDTDLRLAVELAGGHHAWPFLLAMQPNPNDALAGMLAELCHAGPRSSQGGGRPSFPELADLPPVDLASLPALPDGSGLPPLGAKLLRPGEALAVTGTAIPCYTLDWPSWTPVHIPDARCLPFAADDLLLQPNPSPFSYLDPLQVETCTPPVPGFSASPLPGPALRIAVTQGPLDLALFTILGERVWHGSASYETGIHELPVPGLASGVYILAALPGGPATSVVVVK